MFISFVPPCYSHFQRVVCVASTYRRFWGLDMRQDSDFLPLAFFLFAPSTAILEYLHEKCHHHNFVSQ